MNGQAKWKRQVIGTPCLTESGVTLALAALTLLCLMGTHGVAQTKQPQRARGVPRTTQTAPWGALLFSPAARLTVGQPHKFTKIGGVIYKRTDDAPLKCDVYAPVGDGPFPAIIAVHGGGWKWGSKFMMTRHAWLMARCGYVVVAINYRHAPKHPFPAQIEDCEAAIRWIKSNAAKYKVDPDRVGGFGYSAGAQMIGLAANRYRHADLANKNPTQQPSTELKAVVLGGAPVSFDWVGDRSQLLRYWLGGSRRDVPEQFFNATATNFASVQSPPHYFFHGEKDWLVPPSAANKLHKKLLGFGIESRMDLVPNAEHILPFSNLDYMRRGIVFFNRHLKDAEVEPK